MTEAEKQAIERINNIEVYGADDGEAIETVLNLIEKQQAEINALQMEHEHDAKMIDEVKGEAVKLYRTIDEMAKYIARIDIEEDICMNNLANTELCNEECSNCVECIKEYFKKKVEEI